MKTNGHARDDDFAKVAIDAGLSNTVENILYFVEDLYRGTQLEGRFVLDVGCGAGLLALWAAWKGARRVVGLEPASSSLALFRSMISKLALEKVEAIGETVQRYHPDDLMFDIVVMHDSINHLDEEACIHLHEKQGAWERYSALFTKLRSWMNLDAVLIITDASRYNIFATLGVTNPFVRTIQWHKHQPPKIWIQLLKECGFSKFSLDWTTNTPAGVDRLKCVPLGGHRNRLANYLYSRFLTSLFRLEARKSASRSVENG